MEKATQWNKTNKTNPQLTEVAILFKQMKGHKDHHIFHMISLYWEGYAVLTLNKNMWRNVSAARIGKSFLVLPKCWSGWVNLWPSAVIKFTRPRYSSKWFRATRENCWTLRWRENIRQTASKSCTHKPGY